MQEMPVTPSTKKVLGKTQPVPADSSRQDHMCLHDAVTRACSRVTLQQRYHLCPAHSSRELWLSSIQARRLLNPQAAVEPARVPAMCLVKLPGCVRTMLACMLQSDRAVHRNQTVDQTHLPLNLPSPSMQAATAQEAQKPRSWSCFDTGVSLIEQAETPDQRSVDTCGSEQDMRHPHGAAIRLGQLPAAQQDATASQLTRTATTSHTLVLSASPTKPCVTIFLSKVDAQQEAVQTNRLPAPTTESCFTAMSACKGAHTHLLRAAHIHPAKHKGRLTLYASVAEPPRTVMGTSCCVSAGLLLCSALARHHTCGTRTHTQGNRLLTGHRVSLGVDLTHTLVLTAPGVLRVCTTRQRGASAASHKQKLPTHVARQDTLVAGGCHLRSAVPPRGTRLRVPHAPVSAPTGAGCHHFRPEKSSWPPAALQALAAAPAVALPPGPM